MARPGPAQNTTFRKTKKNRTGTVKKEIDSYSKKITCGGKKRKASTQKFQGSRKRQSGAKNQRSRERLCLLTPKLPPRVQLESCSFYGKPRLRNITKKHLFSGYNDDSDFRLKREKKDLDYEYESPAYTDDSVSLLPIVKTELGHKDSFVKLGSVRRITRSESTIQKEEKSPDFKNCLRILEEEWLSSLDRRVMTHSNVMKVSKCPYTLVRRAIQKFAKDRGIIDDGFPDFLKRNFSNQVVKNWGRSSQILPLLQPNWNRLAGPSVILSENTIKEENEDSFLNNIGNCCVISPEKKSSSFNIFYRKSFSIVIPSEEKGLEREVELRPLKALKFSEMASLKSIGWLLSTGSPITNIDWCPVRDNSSRKRTYLACSGDAYEIFHGFNHNGCAPGNRIKEQIIQIWELSTSTHVPPRLVIVFTHLFGFCEDLQWCPFLTSYFKSLSGEKILGIIVLAACGKVYVLDVPSPKYQDRFTVLEAKPRKVLEMVDFFFWKVCFGQRQHQTYLLAAGSREGFITIWDFRNLSSPLHCLQTGHGSITAIAFHTEDRHIIAAGTRSGILELFDMRNLFGSQITRKIFATPIVNLHFIPGTETLIVSSLYGRTHWGVKMFSMIQNAGPQFYSIYIYNLENNHPWGLDCVVWKQKGKCDLISAISTRSGHTILYKHPLKAIFIGRISKKDMCLSSRVLHSWRRVEEKKDGTVRMTVGGPQPVISAPNSSADGVRKFSKKLGKVTDMRVLEFAETKDLVNMNQARINSQLVNGTFMLASGGIAGIVHIFQAKGELM